MWKVRRGTMLCQRLAASSAFSSAQNCSRLSVERRSPSATASSWQHLGSRFSACIAMQRHAASGVSRQQKLAALLDIAWHFGLLQALIPPIEDAFEDVSRLGEACNSWL